MKNQMLITALTLTLISGFSAQAANRTAVAAPTVAIQTAEVKSLDLEQITTQVSPEMRAALEEIKVQALTQIQAQPNARLGGDSLNKVAMQDFRLVSNARAVKGFAVKALKGGDYEVSNPNTGEKIKITISVRCCPRTITITISW